MPKVLKLKSFTLLELLVSLLVSAVLMALTLYALNSFQKLNHIYGLQQQTLAIVELQIEPIFYRLNIRIVPAFLSLLQISVHNYYKDILPPFL
jgi:type II secretory pathway pseudopilin PulG